MREITIGQRASQSAPLFSLLAESFPALPHAALHRAFRRKDIKADGKRASPDDHVSPGSAIRIYIPDEALFGHPLPGAPVVFEDSQILVVNKSRGMSVHPDGHGSGATLVELAREYVGASSTASEPFGATVSAGDRIAPSLCHRIDRNTGGLVVIAKTRGALALITRMLACGLARKAYRCVVCGRPNPDAGVLGGWLLKDARRSLVRVGLDSNPPPGALPIATRYRLLRYDAAANASALDVCPLTGRTHQIRAHMAAAGYPIVGDGKYCPNDENRARRERRQLLWSYMLELPSAYSLRDDALGDAALCDAALRNAASARGAAAFVKSLASHSGASFEDSVAEAYGAACLGLLGMRFLIDPDSLHPLASAAARQPSVN